MAEPDQGRYDALVARVFAGLEAWVREHDPNGELSQIEQAAAYAALCEARGIAPHHGSTR